MWPLAALLLAFLAAGCASTSAGIGVGVSIGDGGKKLPGSEVGLAANEDGDFVEEVPSAPLPQGAGSVRGAQVLKTAFSQVGRPYRYGGSRPETGFDCSGFVRWVYGQYGINLPRRSGDMIAVGANIARKDLRPGDLVFFGKRKNITHVGIYSGGNNYIHSPSSGKSIRESSLDDRARGEYYAGARRILKNPGPAVSDDQKMAWAGQSGRGSLADRPSAASLREGGGTVQTAAGSTRNQAREVAAPAKVKKHKVVAGDTFYKLARKYDVPPELLAKANKISNYKTAVLRPGQMIFVPALEDGGQSGGLAKTGEEGSAVQAQAASVAGETALSAVRPAASEAVENRPSGPAETRRHKIENGDTFYAVAKKYGVKAADLARANNIEDINSAVLRPGRTLIIPVRGAAAYAEGSGAGRGTAGARRHVIESGDTFYAVAKKYGVRAADLAKANNIDDIQSAVLRPGRTLTIPDKSSSGVSRSGESNSTAKVRRHKVESGDTFYGVAKKYGVKSAELAKVNNIKDIKTAVLKPGQTLLVPAASAN